MLSFFSVRGSADGRRKVHGGRLAPQGVYLVCLWLVLVCWSCVKARYCAVLVLETRHGMYASYAQEVDMYVCCRCPSYFDLVWTFLSTSGGHSHHVAPLHVFLVDGSLTGCVAPLCVLFFMMMMMMM